MSVKDAMTQHIIVISDGDPTPPIGAVINQLVARQDHRDGRPHRRPRQRPRRGVQ